MLVAPRRIWTISSMLVVGITVLTFGPPLRGQSGASSIELISATPGGLPAGGQSLFPSGFFPVGAQKISADNRYVVFGSDTSQTVLGGANPFHEVFVRDRQTATTALVTGALNGGVSNGHSTWSAISANGRYVAFASEA